MRLLFNENLSPRLVTLLIDLFPGSVHVRDVGLSSAADDKVWNYTEENGLAIVSKDADFHQRSFLLESGPKIIWIQVGNCSTGQLEELLRNSETTILESERDPHATFLAIS